MKRVELWRQVKGYSFVWTKIRFKLMVMSSNKEPMLIVLFKQFQQRVYDSCFECIDFQFYFIKLSFA